MEMGVSGTTVWTPFILKPRSKAGVQSAGKGRHAFLTCAQAPGGMSESEEKGKPEAEM